MAVVHQIDEEAYGGVVFFQIFSDTLQGIIAMNDRNFLPVIIVCINGYGSKPCALKRGSERAIGVAETRAFCLKRKKSFIGKTMFSL